MSVDISVIVAAYKVENYIERAIRSALDQDGVTLEVVVIDDCSPDRTLETAKAINDPRIRCLRMKKNGGPGAARNKGIAEAKGEWIAVLDGDDAFAPGRLAAMLARAEAKNAQIVADNLTVVREEDGKSFPMFPPERFGAMDTLDLATFITGKVIPHSDYTLGYLKPLFSAAFLKKHNIAYPEDIRIGEDYLLLAAALAEGAVCALEPSAGYLYTARAGSISHRLSAGDAARMIEGDARFLAAYSLSGAAAQAQARRTAELKDMLGWCLLVDALKRKSLYDIVCTALRYPAAPRHLWKPVWVRLKKRIKCQKN